MTRFLLASFLLSLSALAAPAPAAPVYWWIEGESLSGAPRAPQTGASGGLIVATNSAAKATGWFPLPARARYAVWVRVYDHLAGARRGTLTVNGVKSDALGGGGQKDWAWVKAVETEMDEANLELTGLEPWPADMLVDCLLITDDLAYVPPDTRGAGETPTGVGGEASYRPPFCPRVVVITSDWEYGGYKAADEWDEDLAALGASVEKVHFADLVNGDKPLPEGDVYLTTASFNPGPHPAAATREGFSFWKLLRSRAEAGALVLLTDMIDPAQVDPLAGLVGPSFCPAPDPTGRPAAVDPASPVGQPTPIYLPDADRPWVYCRHFNPQPKWFHLSGIPAGWDKPVVTRDKAPLLALNTRKKGLIAATALSKGFGLDGKMLSNLWVSTYLRAHAPAAKEKAQMLRFLRVSTTPRPPASNWPRVGRLPGGRFSWHGKPFFPFGFYAVNKESLPLLGEKGFNAVFGSPAKDYGDVAAANKIAVFGGCSWDLKELAQATRAQRSNPALAAYYVMDEPSNSGHNIGQLRDMIDVVKREDPDTPCFICDNDPCEFPSCLPLSDAVVLDPYALYSPDGDVRRVARDIELARSLTDPGTPIITILQAHSLAGAMPKPTRQQLRAMTYMAYAHGVAGIFYFVFDEQPDRSISYIHYKDGHFDEPLWAELQALAKEYQATRPVLEAGRWTPAQTSHRDVHAGAYLTDKGGVLFLANPTSKAVTGKWTLRSGTRTWQGEASLPPYGAEQKELR